MSKPQKIQSDDYYEILGVKKTDTEDDIMKTFKKLAKKWHPDKNTNQTDIATYNMTKILEAKDVLTDPEKRQIYDKYGKKGLEDIGHQGMDQEQMNDILREMMGGMGGMFGGMDNMFNNSGEDDEIPDVKTMVDLTLEELYNGKTIKGDVKRASLCPKCNGYGSSDGKDHTCDKCNGNGRITKIVQMGPFMQQTQETCDKCKGSGHNKEFIKCDACDGSCVSFENYNYTQHIPPGAYVKYKVTMEQEGNEIPKNKQKNGMSRTDLHIYVNELPHETFKHMFSIENNKIDPANLLIEREITLAESLCGFQMAIPFFNDNTVYVSCNKIIKDNDIVIVKGKGMPKINESGEYGDMYIKLSIKYPDDINSNTKTRIWQLLTGQPYAQKDKEHEYSNCEIFKNTSNANDEDNYDNSESCPVS